MKTPARPSAAALNRSVDRNRGSSRADTARAARNQDPPSGDTDSSATKEQSEQNTPEEQARKNEL
jgi:hypothetical protein